MRKLELNEVVSKKYDSIYIETPRKMMPIYTMPGTETESFHDRRFGDHALTFFVDDPNMIKPEGGMYDVVYAGGYILGEAVVSLVTKDKEKDCYVVMIRAKKIAVSKVKIKVNKEK